MASGGGSGSPKVYSSYYELLSELTSVKKKFVYFFDRKTAITDVWTYTGGVLVSEGLIDEINGGWEIIMTNGHEGSYDFNNKRHFSSTASQVLACCRRSNSDGVFGIGLRGDRALTYNREIIFMQIRTSAQGNILVRTGSSSGATDTVLDVGNDMNFHMLCAKALATSVEFYVDGVLKATHTTDLPTETKLQPFIYSSSSGSNAGGQISYLEAVNT